MGARSEKPKKRRYRLVGGGYAWNRSPNGVKGDTMKAMRRLKSKLDKLKKKARR